MEDVKFWNIINGLLDFESMCSQIQAKFSVLSFFDPERDFQTTLAMDFSVPIGSIRGDIWSESYKENELKIREQLSRFIRFSPGIKLSADNIAIYDKKIVLSVSLEPQTAYTLSIAGAMVSTEGKKISSWDFITPENKTLSLRAQGRVTLYDGWHPPVMEVLSYNSLKKNTSIKVCSLDLENYAKIEVFLKNRDVERVNSSLSLSSEVVIASKKMSAQEEFFFSGIDALKNNGCEEIPVNLENENGQNILIKKEIPLADTLKKLWSHGLYVVVFSDQADRYYNNRVQSPVLLWSVSAHTTMKISQNGEAFFFVNDFSGKPVEGMDLSVAVNEFVSKNTTYANGNRTVTQISPLTNTVYWKQITLWKTNKDGILKINLRGKIENVYNKTFENSYEFDEMGKYDSFFVTGKKWDVLTFVSSQWNGGIAPSNFWYTVNSWYGNSYSLNGDNLSTYQWQGEDRKYLSHIFTDRVLYIPGETVMIKAVIRKSLNLTAPKDEHFSVVVTDPQGKEIQRSDVVANEFGSVFASILLDKKLSLWAYSIWIFDLQGMEINRTGFSLEVFKNPKFTTEIKLQTQWLKGENVEIEKTEKWPYYWSNQYRGKFVLKADLIWKYYSGWVLSNTPFTYKIYRQEYWDSSYWDDCYYGCFWEPNKEFYSEWTGVFDANGWASLSVPIDFSSSYSDYKYVFEVTPKDAAGDSISSTNSTVVRLPAEYKLWDPTNTLTFSWDKRFYPAGTEVTIRGKLNHGAWDENQENKYLLIVKKKTFDTKEVQDVRWFTRVVSTPVEKLVEVIPVTKKRFKIGKDGAVDIDYKLAETAEYVFEFWAVNINQLQITQDDYWDLVDEFNSSWETSLEKKITTLVDGSTDFWSLSSRCIGDQNTLCSRESIIALTGCSDKSTQPSTVNTGTPLQPIFLSDFDVCLQKTYPITLLQRITLENLIVSPQFFTLLTYSDSPSQNPVVSDNKIQVLSEKVSYKIGEKARVLVRLPFSKWKILWTVEKRGVEKSEYIDVPGNVFFKEITVDESFMPNAYIWVVAIDTNAERVPEYKVGYTEIVVDKTDKKATVEVFSDKKVYLPRDQVKLSIRVQDNAKKGKKSELAVMVVDDSLISLMGNIDTNTLQKIWQKLPFQIQTSITNIAMLKNYYFSRPGIVGGSWSGNRKGGDSSVSTRSIFKNTAYYNGHVVTDNNGNATVDFILPDNLTQFRVMVVSNSLDNTFGSWESLFSVQRPVTVEDKTPLILRDNDHAFIWANVFNQSWKDMSFVVSLVSSDIDIKETQQTVTLKNGANTFVSFDVQTRDGMDDINYVMNVVGDSPRNSDSVSGKISRTGSPTLVQRVIENDILIWTKKDYTISIPENTLVKKSTYDLSLSNNPIQHLESIFASLLVYPYGCIEQSVSTTFPNVMATKFSRYFVNSSIDQNKAKEQAIAGISRIASMQVESGWFAYWQWDPQANLAITPYVLKTLIDIWDMWFVVDSTMIDRAINYLVTMIPKAENNTEKMEIFSALARVWKGRDAHDFYFWNPDASKNFTRHEMLAYTQWLIATDKIAYADAINNNIAIIKNMLQSNQKQDYYWYWDEISDKAAFASILMDMDYDAAYITSIIKELSDQDYLSYYISTQSKNTAFSTFIKYVEKYKYAKTSKVQFILNGVPQEVVLSSGNNFTKSFPLSSVKKDNLISLSVKSDSQTPVFVNARLNAYPEDVVKVKRYENGMTLTRTISEVVDTKKLAECSQYYYGQNDDDCKNAFQTVSGNILKKWAIYKITLQAKFPDSYRRSNLTFEDYLPATFRVLNSKFRTNSIATNQATSEGWYFDHVELLPNVIMAHAQYVWQDTIEYTYFVTPEFAWTFLYPPATAYLMYNLDTRAYGEFRTLEVR